MFNFKKLFSTVLIFSFISCATLGAGVDVSPQVKKNYDSFGMVYVVSAKDDTKILSLGTIFAYDENILVSAAHVCMGFLEGAMLGKVSSDIYVKYYHQKNKEVYGFSGVTIEAMDFENDVCLLKKENHPLKPAKLAETSDMELGEKVYVLGVPGGFFPVITEGRYMVNSLKHIAKRMSNKLLISCRIHFGNSGGPVLNKHGEVIGIAVAVIVRYDQLSLITPVEYIQQLIDDNGQ